MEGRRICREHWAEYMRDYRVRSETKRDRENRFQGFQDGLAACLAFLRSQIRDRAYTGYQMAVVMERSVKPGETPQVAERRKLLESMNPQPPQQA